MVSAVLEKPWALYNYAALWDPRKYAYPSCLWSAGRRAAVKVRGSELNSVFANTLPAAQHGESGSVGPIPKAPT